MRRRALLAGCAATLGGLAGCLSNTRDDTATAPEQSETATPTRTSTPTPGVDVSLLSLQPAVVEFGTDSVYLSDDASQYLFVTLDVEQGDPPAADEFTFSFDGIETAPLEPQKSYWNDYNPGETRYSRETGRGRLVFDLPATGDASAAALRWPGGEWTPGAALRERLAAPAPPLSLEWSVAETAEVQSTPTLTLTVTNDGGLPGRFVAGLNRTGPSVAYAPITSVSRRVLSGETVTFELTERFGLRNPGADDVGDDDPDLTYIIDSVAGERRAEVRLVGQGN
jgi:hypothetical protein